MSTTLTARAQCTRGDDVADIADMLAINAGEPGASAAFARIHDRYAYRLAGYCRRRLPSGDDPADAAQDTLAVLWRKRAVVRPEWLRCWLFAVARRNCLNRRVRREKRARAEAAAAIAITAGDWVRGQVPDRAHDDEAADLERAIGTLGLWARAGDAGAVSVLVERAVNRPMPGLTARLGRGHAGGGADSRSGGAMTVGDLCRLHVEWLAGRGRSAAYLADVRRGLGWLDGYARRPVGEFSRRDLDAVHLAMIDAGLGAGRVRRYADRIKRLLAWAAAAGHLDASGFGLGRANGVHDADVWLAAVLRDGPVPVADVLARGAAAGHSAKVVRHARDRIGATTIKPFRQPWAWQLPL